MAAGTISKIWLARAAPEAPITNPSCRVGSSAAPSSPEIPGDLLVDLCRAAGRATRHRLLDTELASSMSWDAETRLFFPLIEYFRPL